ncbi:hypothetical protein Y1Q_0003067 [Alligator mississippiensis]|uniref:Uncharacterized protein n=1 Tax=Alligator mississippiensis TaxID=8496 RepID=A0A151MDE4_ALLMI|nr:hypothetical protein Y1Q_0003067 [Alligator mississippiensis]
MCVTFSLGIRSGLLTGRGQIYFVEVKEYTKLTITTLQVEERTSTNSAVSGTGIGIGIVIGIVITVIGGISYYLYKKGHPKQNRSAVKTASPSEEST